jgi:hypothetical protein
MRTALALLAALGLPGLLVGCIIVNETEETKPPTNPTDECDGVPVEGRCKNDTTIESCFVSEQSGEEPEIVEATCGEHELCAVGPNGARCELQGDCYPGETRCKPGETSVVQQCMGDLTWFDSDCGTDVCVAQPGLGASCLASAPAAGCQTANCVSGTLEYEFLVPNQALTDYDATPQQEPAVDFFITVFDLSLPPAEQLLGMGLTGFGGGGTNPGEFGIDLVHVDAMGTETPFTPTDETYIYFWPILFGQDGQPRMGVALAQNGDPLDDQVLSDPNPYWFYGFAVGAAGSDLGTLVVPIADPDHPLGTGGDTGGAAHLYQWMDYGIFRFEGPDFFPNDDPLSFAVFWKPGVGYSCGNCFLPPQLGGSHITSEGTEPLVDNYDTSIVISGSEDSPSQWAQSVINHEFGHWTMQSYTKSPGEGGVHFVDAASKPGLAYSEGYATFTGQAEMSGTPSTVNPIYFTKQQGTSFWVDISKNSYSGGPLELPDPNGPLDQNINENVVAGMFLSFWATSGAHTSQGLGDAPVYKPLGTNRLRQNESFNRGYATVDFVDYLDALKCSGNATDAQIAAVADGVGYPWDNAPNCGN